MPGRYGLRCYNETGKKKKPALQRAFAPGWTPPYWIHNPVFNPSLAAKPKPYSASNMCNPNSSTANSQAQRRIFKPKNILFLLNTLMCITGRLIQPALWPVCLWIACASDIFGQQVVDRHYLIQAESNINRHLLQNSILGIQADANGELWLASSFGLLQTDGIETRVFLSKNSPDLRADRHKSMCRRRDNNQILLMDAYGGLVSLHNNGRMQRFTSHPDSAFVCYAGQAWKINRHDWQLPEEVKADIVAKQIAYNGKLTAFRIGDEWYHAPGTSAGPGNDFPVIARHGPHLLECNKQKLRFNGPAGLILKPIDDNPYFLWFTDTLVVFTSGKGLFVCDLASGTLREVPDLNPYQKGEVYCALPVSRNSFMLGTYDHGLLRLSFTPATLLNGNKQKSDGSLFIYSYAQYHDTQLFIPSGGLLSMDTAEQHVRRLLSTPSSGHPILSDSRGIVWIHDDAGIIAYRLKDGKTKRLPGSNDRYDLFFELHGQVYACSSDKIYKVDFNLGSSVLCARISGALSFFNMRREGEDAWLLSQNGAYLIDRNFHVKAHILKTLAVRDAVKIGKTWKWATYGSGILSGSNPDTNTPVFTDPYEWSLAAISLRYDPVYGKLWLVTNRAIFILACDANGRIGEIHDKLECGLHLPARELNGGNYPQESVNNLPYYFFPSTQGLLKVPRNAHVQAGNHKLRLVAIISGKDTINDAGSLDLSPDYSFVSVRIKTLQPFIAEGALSYRITPAFPIWRPIPENYTIGPFKLPPGDYILELRSINGVRKTLNIHIPPYWYNTLWFRLSTVCSTVFLALVLLKVRTQKLLKRKTELTYQVNQRTHQLRTALLDLEASRREVTEAYETREKMNAVLLHDIRSPLMFLTESAYHFNRRLRTEAPQYFSTFNLFAGTVKDLYLLATDFNLWLKRPLDGHIQLKPLRAVDLVEDVVRFYKPIIESGTNTFTTDILSDFPDLEIYTHAGIFKSIVRNLIDNSNKYTPGGEIHLSVYRSGDLLRIQVSDSGSGLPDEIIRIYGIPGELPGDWILQKTTADEIGLNLILRFARMLEGRLMYRHETKGSLFTLELPLRPGFG